MATFSENISRIKTRLSESLTSLSNKGVTVAEDAKTVNLANYISAVPITYPNNSNGTNWTAAGENGSTPFNKNQLNYCGYKLIKTGGILIAVPTVSNGYILSSTDNGDNWVASNITVPRVLSSSPIAYGDGKFVFMGQYYSNDGITWIQSSTYGAIRSAYAGYYNTVEVKYNNGVWVLGCTMVSAPIYYSIDGDTFTVIGDLPNRRVYYLDNVNGVWFIVLFNNNVYSHYYSYDGINWVVISTGSTQDLARVKYINGRYVSTVSLGSYSTIRYAYHDALTEWYEFDNITETADDRVTVIAYYDNLWVAYTVLEGFKYSYDGNEWISCNTIFGSQSYPLKITYQDGIWIAYTNFSPFYLFAISIDGKEWTIKTVGVSLFDIKYNHGIFLLLGAGLNNSSCERILWYDSIDSLLSNRFSYATRLNTTNTMVERRYTNIIESGNKWFLQSVSGSGNYYIDYELTNLNSNMSTSTAGPLLESIIWAPEAVATDENGAVLTDEDGTVLMI